ncbi:hypothetical protein GUITHDRAFT_112564 [Guillardia theta CCMP2712]|uniref:EF-hand domain-containing protein n=1 Tax=Guillardia theta (strain CCMP2712) TaxID=905079 RepID=L1IZN3_GUITC|nr:hypothetical protein GUITHDRAFT_112564 [Guillardia theta CCMP2712]EKX41354.1 hypothetical protein GUITHDRAFT_112564 [Guillardia theta CCMP2712]|eukprot:XP_005828334.1 hypothetical protein GUITHDRAFT_112564 [Guillardia theta CCMP2712]
MYSYRLCVDESLTTLGSASMRSSLALEVSFVLSLMVLLKLYTGFVYFVSVEKSLVKATSRLQVLANEASHVLSDAIEGWRYFRHSVALYAFTVAAAQSNEATRAGPPRDHSRVTPAEANDLAKLLSQREVLSDRELEELQNLSSIAAVPVIKAWCTQHYMALLPDAMSTPLLQRGTENLWSALDDFELNKSCHGFKDIISCSRMVTTIGFLLLTYTFMFVSNHGSYISIGLLPLLILLLLFIDEMANMSFEAPALLVNDSSRLVSLIDDTLEKHSQLLQSQRKVIERKRMLENTQTDEYKRGFKILKQELCDKGKQPSEGFERIDVDRDRLISVEDLLAAVQILQLPVSDDVVKLIFNNMNPSSEDKVGLEAWQTFFSGASAGLQETEEDGRASPDPRAMQPRTGLKETAKLYEAPKTDDALNPEAGKVRNRSSVLPKTSLMYEANRAKLSLSDLLHNDRPGAALK